MIVATSAKQTHTPATASGVSSVFIDAFSMADTVWPAVAQSSGEAHWQITMYARHHWRLVVLTNNRRHNCHAKRHAECEDINSDVE